MPLFLPFVYEGMFLFLPSIEAAKWEKTSKRQLPQANMKDHRNTDFKQLNVSSIIKKS